LADASCFTAYSVAQSGEVAAQITTVDRASEIYTIPEGKLTRITHTNDDIMAQLKLTRGVRQVQEQDGTYGIRVSFTSRLTTCRERKYPGFFRPHG